MKRENPVDEFQTVYFITDWWDGPKAGFADFNGTVHCFERVFDDVNDEWSNLYLIRPVSIEEYSLQIESYQLFLDWTNDKSSTRIHPTLDIENKRYHEVEQLLAEFKLQFYSEKYIGEFILIAKDEKENAIMINDFNSKVKWISG
ncbi:hypothetical protein H1230_12380 [Paenibacillus sp. 19GGS1-52]|uniref:hypothetical protein n=1 Tax=Paenibacillus sp. 19GGS1-52 TaxID=2758563 RepID=UPI001EFBABF8|nr:hypothetical protein [Paenibacillus sp. 19GGS1-52]ULO09496.1 hypothetical protein H1230_12380 [Paenibacillus sp. 19GGS1-52]